jgi:hypothetical protein
MDRLVRPNREPDFKVGNSCFWWEERILGDAGTCYFIIPEEYVFLYAGRWRHFNHIFLKEFGREYRDSYATWLLEKELSKG